MKNPPCQSAWRVQNASGNSASSLAVFYVEQVALNRHVSPQPRLFPLSLKSKEMSRTKLRAYNRATTKQAFRASNIGDMSGYLAGEIQNAPPRPRPSDQ